MFAELVAKVEASRERIDTAHPGLDPRDQEMLAIMDSMLSGVEDKARAMAKELLIASQKPITPETNEYELV